MQVGLKDILDGCCSLYMWPKSYELGLQYFGKKLTFAKNKKQKTKTKNKKTKNKKQKQKTKNKKQKNFLGYFYVIQQY